MEKEEDAALVAEQIEREQTSHRVEEKSGLSSDLAQTLAQLFAAQLNRVDRSLRCNLPPAAKSDGQPPLHNNADAEATHAQRGQLPRDELMKRIVARLQIPASQSTSLTELSREAVPLDHLALLCNTRAETFRAMQSGGREVSGGDGITDTAPDQAAMEALWWLVVAAVCDDTHAPLSTGAAVATPSWRPYDARVRAAIAQVADELNVPWAVVTGYELSVQMSAVGTNVSKVKGAVREAEASRNSSFTRKAAITTAAAVGGGVLAATGLIALPALGAALSGVATATGATVLGTVREALRYHTLTIRKCPLRPEVEDGKAASTTGTVVLGSAFGLAGANLAGQKVSRLTAGVNQFEFRSLSGGDELWMTNRAALTIAISGWVTKEDDFTRPWADLPHLVKQEVECVMWECKELAALGNTLTNYLYSQVTTAATKMVLQQTILSGVLSAITWPATVVASANLIDNTWSVALNRSDAAAQLLARLLMDNVHGYRPVTLIGFSLGARVIFNALQYLARQRRFDIVENVFLLGAPVSSNDTASWNALRAMVSGRVVNVFSRRDWLLAFVYRASYLTRNVAGLQPVDCDSIENYCVEEEIDIEVSNYLEATRAIVAKVYSNSAGRRSAQPKSDPQAASGREADTASTPPNSGDAPQSSPPPHDKEKHA